MDVGVFALPTADSIRPVPLAAALEQRGFESLWVGEHTHIPASRRSPYPGGGDLPSAYWECHEPFLYLAQAAVVTQRLKLATGVCLVPQHHPISLAKRVASLDVLCQGRFLFGVGAGWNREEAGHHGVLASRRWTELSERVRAMKLIWTQREAEFHGKCVDFDPLWLGPKPTQRPHPPIYVGGSSSAALRRVVQLGDGWLPAIPNNRSPDDGDAILERNIAALRHACGEAGRSPDGVAITAFGPAAKLERLETLRELGAGRVVLVLPQESERETLSRLDRWVGFVEWAGGASR